MLRSRSARPSYCFPFMPAPRCRPPRHGGSRRCPTKSVRIAWPQILTAPAAAGVHVNRRNLSRKPTVERVSEIPALELPINSNPTRHRHWFQALTQHFCGRCRATSRKLLGKTIPCPTGSDLPKNSILIDGASSFAHQIRLRDKQRIRMRMLRRSANLLLPSMNGRKREWLLSLPLQHAPGPA